VNENEVEAVARAIAGRIGSHDQYLEVPVSEMFSRARYQFLRETYEDQARAAIAALDAARGDGPQCSPTKIMLYADRLQGELNNVLSALKIVQDDVSRLRRAAEVLVPAEGRK
jgi:hypothetical protein